MLSINSDCFIGLLFEMFLQESRLEMSSALEIHGFQCYWMSRVFELRSIRTILIVFCTVDALYVQCKPIQCYYTLQTRIWLYSGAANQPEIKKRSVQ